MKRIVALTLLALSLIALCLQASRWQYQRYEVRHANNEIIRANVNQVTDENALKTSQENQTLIAWKKISLAGRFEPEKEILVRNRYHEGVYGYGVVTLFISDSGRKYWVDRGWVRAGKDAKTVPMTQPVTTALITIEGRVRTSNIEKQLGGTLFAFPSQSGESELEKWNGSESLQTEAVYFDLISTTPAQYTPNIRTPLPELSDGPHLAYAVQWLLFALLVLLGWWLVIREDRKVQSAKV